MSEDFFPFTVGLPHSLKRLFRELDNDSWYECDVKVTGPKSAIFKVYGMRCSVMGGRGDWCRDVVAEGVASDLLFPIIRDRAVHLAVIKLRKQQDEEERAAIMKIAAALLAKHGVLS